MKQQVTITLNTKSARWLLNAVRFVSTFHPRIGISDWPTRDNIYHRQLAHRALTDALREAGVTDDA